MVRVRRGHERGHLDHGWLDTYHTFSFGDYHDPSHMRYRVLRVINEDWIAPGTGFARHPHRDMEILTYVLEGGLRHADSTGGGGVIHAGEWQHMTAGSGIEHSEANASQTDPVHLYQIWIFPDRRGHSPGYSQRTFDPADRRDRWQLIAAPEGEGSDGTFPIHQNARVLLADVSSGRSLGYALVPGRGAWLQVLRGQVTLGDTTLEAGDGAAIDDVTTFQITAEAPGAELLLFDLP
jgi:redox-sensitive bicupin YhaK (pirin superfamily)